MKNRGMLLEMFLNKTILFYEQNNLALFHKKNVDFKFAKLKKENRQIITNKAWIIGKSTVDYYGIYQGVFIAFEAKSCHEEKLPLKNIKNHQRKYIQKILEHKGIAFYIIGFVSFNEFFLVTEKLISSEKKSYLHIDKARKKGIKLQLKYPGVLDFLPFIKKWVKNLF